MTARKLLDPGCDGSILCPVEGHAVHQRHANGRFTLKHIPLTEGQRKTLRERRGAAR